MSVRVEQGSRTGKTTDNTALTRGDPVSIETERTVLRTMTPTDVTGRVVGWFSDPEVMAFLGMEKHPSQRRIHKLVSGNDNESQFMLAMLFKETDQQIGWIRLRIKDGRGTTTLVIGDREYWGRGLGYEVNMAIAEFVFDVLKIHKLCRTAYADNESIHAISKKIGYVLEGVRREHKWRDGKWHDLHYYGLLAEEWKARKANLDR